MIVNTVPIPQPRHRISGNRRYIPKNHPIHEYKQMLKFAWAISGEEKRDGAIHADIVFYLLKPKSTKRTQPTVRPDIDNYVKAVLDVLNGLAYDDDSQIVSLHAQKRYGEPRVEIELGEYEC
ncbi:MAG: RusA family crossover junction endodeoxyribonuclease [Clostridiales bacterium]|nr:RusA family crossover junction endodeoxyribonuclease [Clostridiales bacterium]